LPQKKKDEQKGDKDKPATPSKDLTVNYSLNDDSCSKIHDMSDSKNNNSFNVSLNTSVDKPINQSFNSSFSDTLQNMSGGFNNTTLKSLTDSPTSLNKSQNLLKCMLIVRLFMESLFIFHNLVFFFQMTAI
jgi:hypothetical protein